MNRSHLLAIILRFTHFPPGWTSKRSATRFRCRQSLTDRRNLDGHFRAAECGNNSSWYRQLKCYGPPGSARLCLPSGIANGMVRRGQSWWWPDQKSSGTHHRESVSDSQSLPPVGVGVDSRTVLGGKGSHSRAKPRRALASSAPFCRSANRDGRLRRESDPKSSVRLDDEERGER